MLNRYNRVAKALADLIRTIVNFFFSFLPSDEIYVESENLTDEDLHMQSELWATISAVILTGPGAVNVPGLTARVNYLAFYYKNNDGTFNIAVPSLRVILHTNQIGEITDVAKNANLTFQYDLLRALKVWLDAYYEAQS